MPNVTCSDLFTPVFLWQKVEKYREIHALACLRATPTLVSLSRAPLPRNLNFDLTLWLRVHPEWQLGRSPSLDREYTCVTGTWHWSNQARSYPMTTCNVTCPCSKNYHCSHIVTLHFDLLLFFYRMTKFDIKNYFEKIYGVKVAKVNTRIQLGTATISWWTSEVFTSSRPSLA